MIKKIFTVVVLITMAMFAVGMAHCATPTEAQQQATLLKVEKQWAKKLGIIIPVNFAVKPETEMFAKYLEGGGHVLIGNLYGLSGAADEKGDTVFVWVMRLQDYPEWGDPKKVRRDQIDSVVHELVHVLYRTWGQETATARTADLFIKGKIDK